MLDNITLFFSNSTAHISGEELARLGAAWSLQALSMLIQLTGGSIAARVGAFL